MVGELVLIHDDGPRVYWKFGIVTKLFPGIDGMIRVAQLRTTAGTTTRPIIKLYPLELNVEELSISTDQRGEDETRGIAINSSVRPPRLTAQAARQTWRDRLVTGQL